MIKICKKLVIILPILIAVLALIYFIIVKVNKDKKGTTYINLNNLTYENDESNGDIRIYTLDNYETFRVDYINNSLPDIYVTMFLFDGVGAYKPYDLDDFIENGNDYKVKALDTAVLNIRSLGDYELTGEFEGMLAINTNDLKGNINITLNTVEIDSNSKKLPAIYVYNKDITYTGCKVTIKTKEGTANYIYGGKLKKVSLIGSDELSNYTSKYSDTNTYESYSNYYGVYTKEEVNKVLFAKVTADNEDLMDNDPYYYYKASGAISSDIDLYFEGKGYLAVVSKNKEGIESKGNLSFVGKSGRYDIKSMDDCINTTTSYSENKDAHNNITIDVESMTAEVLMDADEGDAIDSNGTLIINGGKVLALSHPGQDSGVDSDGGIYINGGTIIATGDMYDMISNESKQNFMVLNFADSITSNIGIYLLDSNNKEIFNYVTDRDYKYLVYSSKDLVNGTYSLYKYEGDLVDYEEAIRLAYTSMGSTFNNDGRQNGEPPQMPNGERPELPNGENPNMQGEPPQMPSGERPELPNGETPNMQGMPGMNEEVNPVNKDFEISGISNLFNGISEYKE